MRSTLKWLAAAFVCGAPAVGAAQTLAEELAWAYAITPGPAPPAPVDDGTRHSLPGSDRQFTLDQIRNRMGPADWYPGDHPSMPPIVAVGREAAGIWACSLCHYPNGKGRPENASVVGLPKAYFIQQMYDFKNGLRASAEPRKPNTPLMTGFAVAMTDDEIEASAEYFSSMRWTPWIEVVETDTVPKTRVLGGMHLKLEGAEAGTEPLGNRIVESPVNAEHTELLRNPRSGFIAYVPKGSVARGEALALRGKQGVAACTICHGENLDGLAIVPSLRGRSPSYIARQLADMKEGKRRGAWTPLMTPVVASLGADDILNLAAYLTSLEPLP
jgi:cytochrome c553